MVNDILSCGFGISTLTFEGLSVRVYFNFGKTFSTIFVFDGDSFFLGLFG